MIKELNKKHKKFCHEWVKDMNGKNAAITAGYSEKTAYQIASRLLKDVKIKAYIKELMIPIQEKEAEQEKKDIADLNEVLSYFTSVMRGEEKDQFGLDPQLKDRNDAGKELLRRYEKVTKNDEEKSAIDKLRDIVLGIDEKAS